jgi:hypothetical protein
LWVILSDLSREDLFFWCYLNQYWEFILFVNPNLEPKSVVKKQYEQSTNVYNEKTTGIPSKGSARTTGNPSKGSAASFLGLFPIRTNTLAL